MFELLFNAIIKSSSKPLPCPNHFDGEEWIKVVHSSDLQDWSRLKRYDELECLPLSTYRDCHNAARAKLDKLKPLYVAREKLKELNTDTPIEYHRETVTVPYDWLGRMFKASLDAPDKRETTLTAEEGEIADGQLALRRGRRTKKVTVRYHCPSRVANADEIAILTQRLEAASGECIAALDAHDRFADPLLFISHRWEDTHHPDPSGAQLDKLKKLKSCFIIYDYCSFPQTPRNGEEAAALKKILASMNVLIQNVVVLEAENYLDRGWCLYEYLVGSITNRTVCDEVCTPAMVELRDLVGTRTPASPRVLGSSIESHLQNAKNERILQCVNRVLPLFQGSKFSVAKDREIVKELLIDKLMQALPTKLAYQTYLGEWTATRWTREELREAFAGELTWEQLPTGAGIKPRHFDVPRNLEDAAKNKYMVEDPAPSNAYRSEWEWLELSATDDFKESLKHFGGGIVAAVKIFLLIFAGVVLVIGVLIYLLVRYLVG